MKQLQFVEIVINVRKDNLIILVEIHYVERIGESTETYTKKQKDQIE